MRVAIGETERRRNKQIGFNERHGITPKGVEKAIRDIIDGIPDKMKPAQQMYVHEERLRGAIAEREAEYGLKTPQQIGKMLKKMEKQMFEHARNLEFEEAARVRDQIDAIRNGNLALVQTAN